MVAALVAAAAGIVPGIPGLGGSASGSGGGHGGPDADGASAQETLDDFDAGAPALHDAAQSLRQQIDASTGGQSGAIAEQIRQGVADTAAGPSTGAGDLSAQETLDAFDAAAPALHDAAQSLLQQIDASTGGQSGATAEQIRQGVADSAATPNAPTPDQPQPGPDPSAGSGAESP